MSNENPTSDSDNISAVSSVEAASNDVLAKTEELFRLVQAKKAEFDSSVETAVSQTNAVLEKFKATTIETDINRQKIADLKSSIEADYASIEGLLAKAKNSQTEADAIKTEVATTKGATDEIQKAVSSDQSAISQAKSDVEKMRVDSVALAEKLSGEHADVGQRIAELRGQQSAMTGLLKEVADLKSGIEAERDTAKAELDEIGRAKDRYSTLSSETSSQYEALVGKQAAVDTKLAEIEEARGKIVDFRRRLLESAEDNKSVQDEISDLRNQINATLAEAAEHRETARAALESLIQKYDSTLGALSDDQKQRFDKLHESSEQSIKALLPSAGAAGLSSTYYDAKSRYAPTSYAGKPGVKILTGWRKILRVSVGYNPVSVVTTVVYYSMFLVPLGIVFWGSFTLLLKVEQDPHFVLDYRMLLLRVLIAIPLGTISAYGFSSIRRSRKLYEAYNHKQRVMELYQAFKNEIEAKGDADQVKTLLTIMMETVAEKAWQNVDDKSRDDEELGAISYLERMVPIVAKLRP
jgi:acyl-CoA-binding protein